ncbi:MAG: DUF4157 domain-containing protein [Actinomycetota bacterium]|nr:DUF4157 domain-containing protein [Actinomycetota bacterium]
MERRLGYDFSHVRVHADGQAARSAAALGAAAYTLGPTIVFGQDRYRPGSPAGRRLLAHELAHTVQQGARPRSPVLGVSPSRGPLEADARATAALAGVAPLPRVAGRRLVRHAGRASSALIQCSPQSDTIDKLGSRIALEELLKTLRLLKPPDADVDAELAVLLNGRPDDLWLAQRTWAGAEQRASVGELGQSAQHRPIKAYSFTGTTSRRALVIAGVHGSERQGMAVAEMLKGDLLRAQPAFTVVLVPSLFPDNAAVGAFGTREGATPTNRNFPKPENDLAASGGKDAAGRKILAENQMLLRLIEQFQPERIISIHGTQAPGQAGVFYDPRELTTAEQADVESTAARGAASARTRHASDGPDSQEAVQRELYQAGRKRGLDTKRGEVAAADERLALETAHRIDADTAGVSGRDKREVIREGEATVSKAQKDARHAHGSVAGNVDSAGNVANPMWGGSVPGGVSLGGYAPKRGISVFTVEPPVNRNLADYRTGKSDRDAVSLVDRTTELKAYADAVRTVLLGQ